MLFEPYRRAVIGPARGWQELRTATYKDLMPMILKVVRAEGPVHRDAVVARKRSAFGMARAGRQSQDNVQYSIGKLIDESHVVEGEPGFITLPGQEVMPRRPGKGMTRPIGQISPSELCAGLLLVSKSLGKMTRRELIQETRKQFGFDRTGPDIDAGLSSAIASLISARSLLNGGDDEVWPGAGSSG
jgi:hypothetical protein